MAAFDPPPCTHGGRSAIAPGQSSQLLLIPLSKGNMSPGISGESTVSLTIEVSLSEQAPKDRISLVLSRLSSYGRVASAGEGTYRCTISHSGKMKRARNRMAFWEREGFVEWREVDV
jgi:hypothetical protein